MELEDFLRKHHVTVLPVRITELYENGRKCSLWSMTYLHTDRQQRTHSVTVPVRAAVHATEKSMRTEILPMLARDAAEGRDSFDEYLSNHTNPGPGLTPQQHYAQWITSVSLCQQFDAWFAGDATMRADFYNIEET